MSGLKLRNMGASMYSKPYTWVRSISIATTTNSSSSRTTLPRSSPPLISISNRISHLSPSSTNPVVAVSVAATNLGFRGRCFAFSSSADREGEAAAAAAAAASAGGVGSDMGSEHNDTAQNDLDRFNSLPSMKNQQQKHSSSKLLTLPTILTLGRVAAVPILIGTFYVESWWGTTATTSIFIAAAITDWLDGYLARKMRQGSAFGAFLDPVADKLMVATTLVLLCTKPLEVDILAQAPWLLTVPSVAIIGREITISAVREWAASQNTTLLEAVAVNSLGKWKTATQMIALTILLATRGGSLGGSGYLVTFGVGLLYISAWLAVWSLVVYMKKIWKVLLK